MAKIVKEWPGTLVSIAVEVGRDDANKEQTHVHVYKNGRRTDARISLGKCYDTGINDKEYDEAERLFNQNLREIERYYQEVKDGKHDG